MAEPSVPRAATVLGTAGLIPFVIGAAYLITGPSLQTRTVLSVLIAYGAIILTFVGAVYWGLAMHLPPLQEREQALWMSVSVVPSLLGWSGLLLDLLAAPLAALSLLIAGFGGVYLIDRIAIARDLAPPWYGRLRFTLTVVVTICLVAAGIGFAGGG